MEVEASFQKITEKGRGVGVDQGMIPSLRNKITRQGVTLKDLNLGVMEMEVRGRRYNFKFA